MNDQYPPIVAVEEISPILNLLLHVLYSISCGKYNVSPDDIAGTMDALTKYGYSLHLYVHPTSELYKLALNLASSNPLEMYMAAASHNLDTLAISVSSHMLPIDLSDLTDEVVEKMGATYLRRLIFLHLGRVQALKRLLAPPPEFHRPTASCGYSKQRQLARAWSLATAGLAWEAHPGM